MKKNLGLSLQKPPGVSVEEWAMQNFKKIEEAAMVDAAIDSADAFSAIDHTGYTIFENVIPGTSTLTETQRALATLIQYLQNQGPRRT